jgi:hypothetical protein
MIIDIGNRQNRRPGLHGGSRAEELPLAVFWARGDVEVLDEERAVRGL